MKNDTKKGHWFLDIEPEKASVIGYVCSECNSRTPIKMTKYCSNCGCKMNAEKDGTILYRPHKLTLEDAILEAKEFDDIAELCEYLVKEHKGAFDIPDIYISYYGYDERIGWETYAVAIGKNGEDNYLHKFNAPQIIGFCTGI